MIISSYCTPWRLNYPYSSSRAGQTPLHWRCLQLFSQLQPCPFCVYVNTLYPIYYCQTPAHRPLQRSVHTWPGMHPSVITLLVIALPTCLPPPLLAAFLLLSFSGSPFQHFLPRLLCRGRIQLSLLSVCQIRGISVNTEAAHALFRTHAYGKLWLGLQKMRGKKDWSFQDSFSAAQNESSTHKNYENFRNGTLTYLWRASAWQWYKSCL